MAGKTIFLDVWGYNYPCARCGHTMTWVYGLRPWYQPSVGELVTCDKPLAVAVASDILAREGYGNLAAQLKPRPASARGASFNPNTCIACGDQADWRMLNEVILRALHDDILVLARAQVGTAEWQKIIQERTYVIAI